MALITKPGSITKGEDSSFTLDKAELVADTIVAANIYFSDTSNWNKVVLVYKSTSGGQKIKVFFDATQTTPAANFISSTKAMDNFEIQSLVILDFDAGSLVLERADLTVVDFDVTLQDAVVAPVATSLQITQEPTTAEIDTVITPSLTVEIRDQFNTLISSTAEVTVAITSGTGTLTGTLAQNAVAGVATFNNLQIDAADNFILTFSSTGLTSDVSTSFTISAPAAANIFLPLFKNADITLTNGDLTATNTGSAVPGALEWVYQEGIDVSGGGKFYFEYTLGTVGGLTCFGGDFTTSTADLTIFDSGGQPFLYNIIGSDTIYKCNNDSGLFYNQSGVSSGNIGAQLLAGSTDKVMIALDIDNSKYYMGVNGVWNGADNPSTNTGGNVLALTGFPTFFPAIAVEFGSDVSINTVADYTVPTGFDFLV